MRARWAAILILPLAYAVAAAEPVPTAAEVSFFKNVLPILRQKNCTGCHQPAKQGGEYVMTEFAALLKGGESGEAAVVPGDDGVSLREGGHLLEPDRVVPARAVAQHERIAGPDALEVEALASGLDEAGAARGSCHGQQPSPARGGRGPAARQGRRGPSRGSGFAGTSPKFIMLRACG